MAETKNDTFGLSNMVQLGGDDFFRAGLIGMAVIPSKIPSANFMQCNAASPHGVPHQSVNEDLWHSLQESFTVPFTRMFILLSDLEPRCSDAAVATIMQGIVRNLRGIKHIPQLDMKVTVTVVNKRGAHAPCLVCLTLCTYISAMCTMPGHSDIVKELGTLWCPLVI